MELKPLHELNQEFQTETFVQNQGGKEAGAKKSKKKKRGMLALISDLLFYIGIFVALFAALTSNIADGFVLPVLGVAISSLRLNIYSAFIIFGTCVSLSFVFRALSVAFINKSSQKGERAK